MILQQSDADNTVLGSCHWPWNTELSKDVGSFLESTLACLIENVAVEYDYIILKVAKSCQCFTQAY
jgi:hypothetical protein